MSEPEQSEKESEREAKSAVRVSSWAIGIAIVLGLIALGLAWPWLHR